MMQMTKLSSRYLLAFFPSIHSHHKPNPWSIFSSNMKYTLLDKTNICANTRTALQRCLSEIISPSYTQTSWIQSLKFVPHRSFGGTSHKVFCSTQTIFMNLLWSSYKGEFAISEITNVIIRSTGIAN